MMIAPWQAIVVAKVAAATGAILPRSTERAIMADAFDRLLARADIGIRAPASWSEIDALAEHYGAALPAFLVQLWLKSDGIDLPTLHADIPGPTEIRQIEGPGAEWLVERGFVPIFDDHESNYLAVLVRSPLAFRVSYLPHDDGSRLIYRDLDGFAQAVFDALDRGKAGFYKLDGDYPPDSPRPTSDQVAAQKLLATSGDNEEWNYAIQLLDASNLAEWENVLETNHFVRRDALARMRQMKHPAIRDLLRRDQSTFEEFAAAVANAARNAGLRIGKCSGDALQIDGHWIGLETFFYRRNIANALPRLIDWVKDLCASRNPHDRPGHFFVD
jgi:hypothetical protein